MVLIVLSCILVPLSVVAVWAHNQVLDTDEYVATVAPLARNEEIANALSVRVTNELFDNVDVEATRERRASSESRLPRRAAHDRAPRVHRTGDAAVLPVQAVPGTLGRANRNADEQVVKALTGSGKVIKTKNGEVVLDLSALVVELRSQLSERGIGIFDKLPIGKLSLQFELFDAEGLKNAQAGVKLLDRLAIVLPILAIVFAAAGIWLAGDRRKALMRWGIGVAIASLVLGFALLIGRDAYLHALPADANRVGGKRRVRHRRALHAQLEPWCSRRSGSSSPSAHTSPARHASRRSCAARPRVRSTPSATKRRRKALTWARSRTFVARHTNGFRVVGIIFAFVILIVLNHPTALTVFVLLGILLVYFGVVGILARMGRDRMATPTAAQ